MGDKQVRARVSDETALKIDSIAEEINEKVPEAAVNVSSILRYAIEEYIKRYEAKKHETAVFVELPIQLPNEDLEALCEHLIAIRKIYQEINHPLSEAFSKQIKGLTDVIVDLASKSKKTNNDREVYEKRLKDLYKDDIDGE